MANFLQNAGKVLSTFGNDVVQTEGQAPPQYQADATGQVTNVAPAQAKPGQMFKNLLQGALAGLAAKVPRGADAGASFGAGLRGATHFYADRDAQARQNAQQNFENKEKAQEQMDISTLRKAQAAAAQQASIRDALKFNEQDPASIQAQADRWNANTEAGAKPLQMYGKDVGEFNSLDDAEQFANQHSDAVVAGFHSQIVRNPGTGKWAIQELPSQEAEFDLGVKDKNGKPVTAKMTPVQYSQYQQNKQNFERQQKESAAKIAEENSAVRRNDAEANKANADAKASALVNPQGAEGLTGDAYVKSLAPGYRQQVQAIIDGRQVLTPQILRTKEGQALSQMVNRADGEYDQTKADAYDHMRRDFTSGTTAKGLNALNTALGHLDRFNSHITLASSLPGVRSIAQLAGNTNATASNADQHALADELGRAYKNGVVTDEERNAWTNMLNAATPAERKGNAVEIAKLLKGRLDSYQHQWDTGVPSPRIKRLQILSPEAAAAYNRVTGEQMQNSGMVTLKAPNGQMKQVPADQAQHYVSMGAQVIQ